MAISKLQQAIIRHFANTHRIGGHKPDMRPWYRRHKPKRPEDHEALREYLARPLGCNRWDLVDVILGVQTMTRRQPARVPRKHLICLLRRQRRSSWWGRAIDTACEIGLLMTDENGDLLEMPSHPDEM